MKYRIQRLTHGYAIIGVWADGHCRIRSTHFTRREAKAALEAINAQSH